MVIGVAIGLSHAEAILPQPYTTSTISWIAAGIGVITLFWGLAKSVLESFGKPRLNMVADRLNIMNKKPIMVDILMSIIFWK